MRLVQELCKHEDEATTELHQSMREWGRLLRDFYRDRKMSEFKLMREVRDCHATVLGVQYT